MSFNYVPAWELRNGDEVHEQHEKYTHVRHVIDIVRHTSEAQGRTSVVLVGFQGSYSPSWKVYQADHPVKVASK